MPVSTFGVFACIASRSHVLAYMQSKPHESATALLDFFESIKFHQHTFPLAEREREKMILLCMLNIKSLECTITDDVRPTKNVL
jgi:hypothetical protein